MASTIFSTKLRDASFKGVPFFVSNIKKTFLRRTVIHEYPQRDVPYVEDLGKGVTKYDVTAFLVGDTCVEKAKKLQEVLLSEGPGTFINPWEGNLRVNVWDASSIEYSNNEHRYCSIHITFIEPGQLEFPAFVKNKVAWVRQIADKLNSDAGAAFVDQYQKPDFYKIYQSALNGTLLEEISTIKNSDLAVLFDISDELIELAENGIYLLSDEPEKFSDKVLFALGLSRFSSTKTRWSGVVDQISNLVSSDSLNHATEAKIAEAEVVSTSENEQITNQAAVESLFRQTLTAQAVGAASMIGSDTDTSDTEETETETETQANTEASTTVAVEELLTTRDNFLGVIDAELKNPLISDEMFISLLDARCAVFSMLTEKAEGLSRLINVKSDINEPAVVVAYDYYDDSNRSAEIVTRNKIIHSSFCPNNLKLLSK